MRGSAILETVFTDVAECVETGQLDFLVITSTTEGEGEVGENAIEMRGDKQPIMETCY